MKRTLVVAIVLSLLAIGLLLTPAKAQQPKLDITPLLKNLGACSVITHKGDILSGGCYTPISWRWGSTNIGLTWDTNDSGDEVRSAKGVGGVVFAVGVRADKAWNWTWSRLDLEKRGVAVHFVVPAIEVGPMGGYHHRLGWITGGFLNAKWPF